MSYSDIKESLKIVEKDIQRLEIEINISRRERIIAQKQISIFKKKELNFQKKKESIEKLTIDLVEIKTKGSKVLNLVSSQIAKSGNTKKMYKYMIYFYRALFSYIFLCHLNSVYTFFSKKTYCDYFKLIDEPLDFEKFINTAIYAVGVVYSFFYLLSSYDEAKQKYNRVIISELALKAHCLLIQNDLEGINKVLNDKEKKSKELEEGLLELHNQTKQFIQRLGSESELEGYTLELDALLDKKLLLEKLLTQIEYKEMVLSLSSFIRDYSISSCSDYSLLYNAKLSYSAKLILQNIKDNQSGARNLIRGLVLSTRKTENNANKNKHAEILVEIFSLLYRKDNNLDPTGEFKFPPIFLYWLSANLLHEGITELEGTQYKLKLNDHHYYDCRDDDLESRIGVVKFYLAQSLKDKQNSNYLAFWDLILSPNEKTIKRKIKEGVLGEQIINVVFDQSNAFYNLGEELRSNAFRRVGALQR